MVLWSCSSKDEPTPAEDKPLIILDTDIGSSTDDLFAMEMLYDYDRRGLCRLLGIIVNREGENCAACADVIDHSVTICSMGFLSCLAQLLQSEGDQYSPLNGVELVRQKVRAVYLQGGVSRKSEEPDYNMPQESNCAHNFFRLFPNDVDLIFSPLEVGQRVEYVPEQVIADIDWTDIHPVKQVYMTCNCNTGQRMWDVCAVMNAVDGESFILSERGNVVLTPECYTVFTPNTKGNCRYQKPGDPEWAQQILNKIRALAQWRP